MDRPNHNPALLELSKHPVFTVKNGLVTYANACARGLMIVEQLPVSAILSAGAEEYSEMVRGSLAVTVAIGGFVFPGTVTRYPEEDLFVLERSMDEPVPQVLALASMVMRNPVGRIMGCLNGLTHSLEQLPLDDHQQALLREVSRSSHQLLRLLGNMSDILPGSHEPYWGRMINPHSELQEICGKIGVLLETQKIRVTYSGPQDPVYLPMDRDRLERAVHNLVLNAAKVLHNGGNVDITLTQRGNTLLLTVADDGPGIPDDIMTTLFTRYLRPANLDVGADGIGLGLPFVRAFAMDHGGTVLVERPPQGGTRVTVTVKLLKDKKPDLRAPSIPYDYAGGYDHTLVELSEVLPLELYE